MTAAAETSGRLSVAADDYLGETPVWSTTEQALYWVNCEDPPRLRRWAPGSDDIQSWSMPDRTGGMALRRDGDPIVCAGPAVYNLDKATGELSLLARSPFPDYVKLHESCVDRRGRLWVGVFDMRLNPQNFHPGGGALFRLDGDRLIPMLPNFSVANALAFSPDGKVMYFTNATTGVIWAADIEPANGAILGMREFLRMVEGEIGDGATVDAEGGYWLAMVSHGEVRRYLPDGTLDRTSTDALLAADQAGIRRQGSADDVRHLDQARHHRHGRHSGSQEARAQWRDLRARCRRGRPRRALFRGLSVRPNSRCRRLVGLRAGRTPDPRGCAARAAASGRVRSRDRRSPSGAAR